jgi:hypothetical protein
MVERFCVSDYCYYPRYDDRGQREREKDEERTRSTSAEYTRTNFGVVLRKSAPAARAGTSRPSCTSRSRGGA